MKDEIYIYGAGGHAKVVAEIAEQSGAFILGAIDKNLLKKLLLDKYNVYLTLESTDLKGYEKFVIAVGNNLYRKRIASEELKDKSYQTLIHPHSYVSNYAEIDEGTVLMAGTVVNADAQIGKHCIINTNASIDHDCLLEDFVHISPNASLAGNVFVGEGTHVGIGACVIQGVKIGRWCTIGAGSVIIKDVPDGCTVVGNPGRIIKENQL